jgi:hypothetical protein
VQFLANGFWFRVRFFYHNVKPSGSAMAARLETPQLSHRRQCGDGTTRYATSMRNAGSKAEVMNRFNIESFFCAKLGFNAKFLQSTPWGRDRASQASPAWRVQKAAKLGQILSQGQQSTGVEKVTLSRIAAATVRLNSESIIGLRSAATRLCSAAQAMAILCCGISRRSWVYSVW